MIRLPPRSTRQCTLFPYTTLFRSHQLGRDAAVSVQPVDLDRREPAHPAGKPRDPSVIAEGRVDERRRPKIGADHASSLSKITTSPVVSEPEQGRTVVPSSRQDRKSTRLNSSH